MGKGGLYTGFDEYRVPDDNDIATVLREGIVAVDTNFLLNLYRYNEKTVEELLAVLDAVSGRLFVPHQVIQEFWRNRESVIAGLAGSSKEVTAALAKNARSTKDAFSRWGKRVALPTGHLESLYRDIDGFFENLHSQMEGVSATITSIGPTASDPVLRRLEGLLAESVGEAPSQDEWDRAVAEGARRVKLQIPPGYMDADKLDSDLPEGASGDYLVWRELLHEGDLQKKELVLVTADTKEDWWNRSSQGALLGPRRQLLAEYLDASGCRLVLLEPADLLKHSSAVSVGTSSESVEDIERVRDEEPERALWEAASVEAVLAELDTQGHVQANVVREAAGSAGGRISRDRVYELDGRDRTQTLNGFTKPVRRVTADLQARGVLPQGLPTLLNAVYEGGEVSTHFVVPHDVVQALGQES